MNPFRRYPRVWLLAGGAVCTAGIFFAPITFSEDSEFWERVLDAGHVPFFIAFTIFLYVLSPAGWTRGRRIAAAAATAAGVAAAIEVIQPYFHRGESFADFAYGCMGIGVASFALGRWPRPTRRAVLLQAVGLAVLSLVVALHPAYLEARGLAWRRANFPLLADFESDDELRLWVGSGRGRHPEMETDFERSTDFASHGTHSLKVRTRVIRLPSPSVRILQDDMNWRGFEALAFDLYNPEEPWTLSLRIDDDTEKATGADRFNTTLPMVTGWNHFRIPLAEIESGSKSHPLRLQSVRRVVFYLHEPTVAHEFYLDHLRLEGAAE